MSEATDRGKPAGLREVTLLMCFFNVAGLFVMRPHEISPQVFLWSCGIAVAVSFVVLWHFWLGRNWARWLVLVTSGVALANLSSLGSLEPAGRWLVVAEAMLALWLFFWLNTRPVRAFFSKRVVTPGAA